MGSIQLQNVVEFKNFELWTSPFGQQQLGTAHHLRIRIFIPDMLVQLDSQHEQYAQNNYADDTENPIDGTF